jgi:hypothetical protein
LESTLTKTIVLLATKRSSLFTKLFPGIAAHRALIHIANAQQALVAVLVAEEATTKAETATTHRFLEHSKDVAATIVIVSGPQPLRLLHSKREAAIIAHKLLLPPTAKGFKDVVAITRTCQVSSKDAEVTTKICLESSRAGEATISCLVNSRAVVVTITNCLAPTKAAMGITKVR